MVLEDRIDRALRTTKREAIAMATLWADSSGLPQFVYKPKGGEWKNTAAAMHDPKGGETYAVTVLPAYFFGFVDQRAAAARAKLTALGYYR